MLTVPRPRRPSLRARESDVLFTRTPDVLEMVRLDRIPTPLYFSPEIFLAVLSQISVLSSKKVMYHFVLGLTAKLVGTEVGIIEPITSFSSCFGATFMPHKMNVYAELLIRNAACVASPSRSPRKTIHLYRGTLSVHCNRGNLQRVELRVGIHQGRVVGCTDVGRRQQRLTIWSLGLASVLTVAVGPPWRFARALVLVGLSYGVLPGSGGGGHGVWSSRRQRLVDKLKESTSLTNHAGNVGYADVAFETSPRFNCTPLVCSLLRVVRVSIMVLWSSVTELTLARTAVGGRTYGL